MSWMKTYESLEEAIENIWETPFEKENDIKIINKEIKYNWEDIVLINVGKSNGEIGIVIVYKPFKRKEKWVVWVPSGNQQKYLYEIGKELLNIDKHNSQFWKGEEE